MSDQKWNELIAQMIATSSDSCSNNSNIMTNAIKSNNLFWTQLEAFPAPRLASSQLVKINNNEFARNCKDNQYNDINYIHKYNINTDKWTKWVQYPQKLDNAISQTTIAFNQQKGMLYVNCQNNHKSERLTKKQLFCKINIETNQSEIFESTAQIGEHARAIMIKDQFHIIGGYNNASHYKWNAEKKQFERIYTFKFGHWGNYFITEHEILYLKRKNALWLIGGLLRDPGDLSSRWRTYRTDDIYSYDLAKCEWHKLQIKLPNGMHYFGCVVSADEKYITLLNGELIFVLDLETMKFMRCDIKCPINCTSDVIAIGMNGKCENEELLVQGYIRKLWKLKEFGDLMCFPNALVKIIDGMFTMLWDETIHLIDFDGLHWRIRFDDILKHAY